jgi:hypothetical protein
MHVGVYTAVYTVYTHGLTASLHCKHVNTTLGIFPASEELRCFEDVQTINAYSVETAIDPQRTFCGLLIGRLV